MAKRSEQMESWQSLAIAHIDLLWIATVYSNLFQRSSVQDLVYKGCMSSVSWASALEQKAFLPNEYQNE